MRKLQAECGNFTVLEFDTQAEFNKYLEDNKDLFRFVGYSGGKQDNGKYKLVY